MMVRLPPSSMLRAAPKKRLGRCKAFESTPRRDLSRGWDHGVVSARQAGDGVERMTTSRLCSTAAWPSREPFPPPARAGPPAHRKWN